MRVKVALKLLIIQLANHLTSTPIGNIAPLSGLLPIQSNPITTLIPSSAAALVFLCSITPGHASRPIAKAEVEDASLLPNPGFFKSHRCPWPRFELCNTNTSWGETYLDAMLEKQWELDKAHGNFSEHDRELVLWSLAGGASGKWWWESKFTPAWEQLKDTKLYEIEANSHETGNTTSGAEIEKLAPHFETLGSTFHTHRSEDQIGALMAKLLQERLNLEERDKIYMSEEAGFCCNRQQGEMCLAFRVDPTLLACYNEDLSLIFIPPSTMMSARTLDYIKATVGKARNHRHEPLIQIQKGNLRNFSIPGLGNATKEYRPTPTPDYLSVAVRSYLSSDGAWAALVCFVFSAMIMGFWPGTIFVLVLVAGCILENAFWPRPTRNPF